MKRLQIPGVFSVFALMAVAGCGGGSDFAVAPVSGQVTLNGEPLPKAIVTFVPTEGGAERPSSVGETDSQGNFTLWTTTGEVGAIPGTHKVMIALASDMAAEGQSLPDDYSWREAEKTNPIPQEYSGPNTPLTFNVPPNGTESAKLNIEGKKK
jgi:hypothetical protein